MKTNFNTCHLLLSVSGFTGCCTMTFACAQRCHTQHYALNNHYVKSQCTLPGLLVNYPITLLHYYIWKWCNGETYSTIRSRGYRLQCKAVICECLLGCFSETVKISSCCFLGSPLIDKAGASFFSSLSQYFWPCVAGSQYTYCGAPEWLMSLK